MLALAAAAAAWLAAAALLWRTQVPSGLELPRLDPDDHFTGSHLDRAERYERFLRATWALGTLAVLVAVALVARRAPRLAREIGLGPVATGIVLGMVTLVTAWFAELPFALAAQWWRRRHGLLRQGYLDLIVAPWVGLLLGALVACLLIAVVLVLARRFARWWWVGAASFVVVLGTTFAFVQPLLVAGDLQPIRREAVAADARALAREVGVRGTPVDVDDVGDVTTQANALALGLGPTKRVVLWSTLLDGRFPRDEIRVVVAHEFGHIVREHAWKGVAWFALFAFPATWLVAVATRRRGGLADPAVLPFAVLALLAVSLALTPLGNAVSRRYEAEADWVALEATRDPRAARTLFARFSRTGRADPSPPTWAYLFLETHPTLIQRIAMATAWDGATRRRREAAPRGGS